MEWLLARLRGRNRPGASLVCYLRENGPIAYSTDIFGADPRERIDAMLATGLTWYWRSAGHEPIAREWTNLSRWSLAALLKDLAAQHDGHHADILIVGVEDDGESADAITDARVGGVDARLRRGVYEPVARSGDASRAWGRPPLRRAAAAGIGADAAA